MASFFISKVAGKKGDMELGIYPASKWGMVFKLKTREVGLPSGSVV